MELGEFPAAGSKECLSPERPLAPAFKQQIPNLNKSTVIKTERQKATAFNSVTTCDPLEISLAEVCEKEPGTVEH